MDRRRFVLGSLAAAGATALTTSSADAIDPIRRAGRPQFKLGLAAYSFRQALDLRRKPPTMTLDGFIDLAATMPFDAVELTEYYFPETGTRYLAGLKGRCTRLGLDVSRTARCCAATFPPRSHSSRRTRCSRPAISRTMSFVRSVEPS